MIKLILIILILLFVYFIVYFLYSMVNKNKDITADDNDYGELHNVDVSIKEGEINYIDIPSELENLESKKKN